MLGLYLSGTGNTKHCIIKLLDLISADSEMIALSVSDEETIVKRVKEHDTVVLAYPTQFSNAPYMIRDFIKRNNNIWNGKKVFCMTTMGAFSGDGTGCCARVLRKHGAVIIGGMQIKMPDAVCDSKLLKKTADQNREIIRRADLKIEKAAKEIMERNKYPREGLSLFSHIVGLMGQRLWFYRKTTGYSKKLKINDDCVLCGVCVDNCPMGNLRIQDGKVVSNDRCTMCYRCISNCPKQAITLLGDKVYEQCRFENY
ncbi:MAG: EFR1 family ferrodoxin [Eubacterium sp.]|nr:EFR1 family ferrodoxin [Eubacterium sp.]